MQNTHFILCFILGKVGKLIVCLDVFPYLDISICKLADLYIIKKGIQINLCCKQDLN